MESAPDVVVASNLKGTQMALERQLIVSAPDAQLISIVDDDESVREAITSLLRSAGFRAKGIASAETFLRSPLLQETACLILDVRMPGLSGPELQRHLATEGRRVPIIFITAHGEGRVREEVTRAGAVAFLSKPFSEEALLRAVYFGLGKEAGNENLQATKQVVDNQE